MSLPICPNCRSQNIQWGGDLPTGDDRCRSCGYQGPVARFHEAAEINDLATLRSRPFPVKGKLIPETTPMPSPTYRSASKPEPRHPQQLPKDTEHFWWQDI